MNIYKYVDHGYSHRVRVGNWFEAQILDELNKKHLGNPDQEKTILSKFRNLENNLNKPTELTACAGSVAFGSRITLIAPHVPNCYPPIEGKKGLCLGGRIALGRIDITQELEDGCSIVGLANLAPVARSTFVITSPDYCDRQGEVLKYNQEFLLTLSSSLNKKLSELKTPSLCRIFLALPNTLRETNTPNLKLLDSGSVYALSISKSVPVFHIECSLRFVQVPLYIRYDPDCLPGCNGNFPIYLSKHSMSNDRWRVLPIQRPDLSRFEQEGKSIPVNLDVIINHCATNKNLGINEGVWAMGLNEMNYAPLMKTCLGVTGKELPHNIWQIHCLVNPTS